MIDNIKNTAHECCALILIFVASLLLSCDEEYMNPIQIESSAAFSSISDIDALPFGESFTFSFAAAEDWVIKGLPGWITSSKTKGSAGTYTIQFNVNANDSNSDRDSHITFATSKGSLLGEFDVRQKHPYLTISSNAISFSWDQCSNEEEGSNSSPIDLKITSNIDWKIDIGASDQFNQQFSISSVEGRRDSIISIIPRNFNLSDAPFSTTIRLLAMKPGLGGSLSPALSVIPAININIRQSNLRFIVNGSTSNSNVNILDTNKKNSPFIIDSELPWTIDTITADWICLNSLKGNAGRTTLSLSAASANPTRLDRTGYFVVSAANGKVKRTVTVRQYGYTFDLDYDGAFHFANDETLQRPIQLTTKGDWKVDSIPDWLYVSPTFGEGNAEITVSPKSQNLSFKDNDVNIIIRSTLNSFADTVHVSQDRFLFQVIDKPEIANIPTLSTATYYTSAEISGEYSIEGIPDWLDVSITPSGEKNKYSMSVTPKSINLLQEDRHATLKLISLNHKANGIDVIKEIPVLQNAFIFDVGKKKHIFDSPIGAENSVLSVPISCTGDAVITTDAEWFYLDRTNVTDEGILTVTASDNFTEYSRSGSITVSSVISGYASTINLTQNPYLFDKLDKSIDFSASANEEIEQIICSGKWAVTCPDTWVAITPSTISGNGSLLIRVQENPLPVDRSSIITVSSKDNPSFYKNININQTQHQFNLDTTRLEFGPLETGVDKKVKVNASFNWTAHANADWISVYNDPGHNEVRVRVLANTDTVRRSSTVVVKSDESPLKKNVTIVQEPYIFNCGSVDNDISATAAENVQIQVKCSGKWSVSSPNNWINCVQSTFSGNGVITASFLDNPNNVGRNGSIVVKCEDNDNIFITILIYQLPQ